MVFSQFWLHSSKIWNYFIACLYCTILSDLALNCVLSRWSSGNSSWSRNVLSVLNYQCDVHRYFQCQDHICVRNRTWWSILNNPPFFSIFIGDIKLANWSSLMHEWYVQLNKSWPQSFTPINWWAIRNTTQDRLN